MVLVPVGHLTNDPERPQDWNSLINHAREVVFETIKSRTGASLRDSVIHESVETPMSWKSKFNLDRGAILGLSHSFFNVLSFRPKIRHDIRGLYFVGASTHPGAGVPVALSGARIVSDCIVKDFTGPPVTRYIYWMAFLFVPFVSVVFLWVL